MVQRREQQRLFEDFVPDAFSACFKGYKEVPPEPPPTVQRTCNCLLPPKNRNYQPEATYKQRQPVLRAVFKRYNHHVNWFFYVSHVQFMQEKAWVIGACATLSKRSALRGKSLEEMWPLVPE